MSTPNRPEMLGALIFDLDGTLADTLPVVVDAFQQTFVDFGLPVRSTKSRGPVVVVLANGGQVGGSPNTDTQRFAVASSPPRLGILEQPAQPGHLA